MNSPSAPQPPQPAPRPGVRWLSALLWALGIIVIHMALPWAISLLTPRWGWVGSVPCVWNWLALIPIAVCLVSVAWSASLHSAAIPHGREMAWVPDNSPDSRSLASHVLVAGPYRYSRNPMYVLEMALWLGWALFFGSAAVLIAFVLWCVVFVFVVVRDEERVLEARFGDAYLQYKKSVPRWFGIPRR